MTRDLLLRGMLVGLLAGLLSFGFLKVFGVPSIDRSIAFEDRMESAKAATKAQTEIAMGMTPLHPMPEPELVSRSAQGGIGLFTGVAVYGAALGGLFSLVFAFAHGRLGRCGARTTAALLSAAGFIALYVVPNAKYPANPPAVTDPETIGVRTALYFFMIALSVFAMVASVVLRQRLVARHGAWNAGLLASAAYLVVMAIAGLALPGAGEIPAAFPAAVLWDFRLASFGSQLILWATLGLGFGALAERLLDGRRPWRFETA